ncbi:HAD family hydrolase [Devosia beringensis]|uniref:HAD family hydrolase n=1 Tax=Devosia beringensis TaxID=2657486 RepID=UPI001E3775D5|nr:HAD-IA family hydrolase [Devosia beringensis]
MATMVGWHAATRLDLGLVQVISRLRRRRESLAEAEQVDFESALIADVAAASNRSQAAIRALLDDWFNSRPLPFIARYRVPGAAELFNALRQNDIRIGILSDHRATEKLAALGLAADIVVSAVDPDISVQKPDPKGLKAILQRTGYEPDEAIMIGDRADRDGAVARRAGTGFLLRGKGPDADFQSFEDPVFYPILHR